MDLQEFLKEVDLPESIVEECGGSEDLDGGVDSAEGLLELI